MFPAARFFCRLAALTNGLNPVESALSLASAPAIAMLERHRASNSEMQFLFMSSADQPTPPASSPAPIPSPAGPESGTPPEPPAELTPEEQMARFEEALKETDWGHQPC
jgi:hypothetical protein